MNIWRRQTIKGFSFSAPALLVLTVIHFYPTIATIYYSFTASSLGQVSGDLTVKNYAAVLADEYFLDALIVSLKFSGITLTATLILSFFTAMALVQITRMQSFFRFIIFIPVLLSESVTAVVWKIMFSANGIINICLSELGIIKSYIAWLVTPGYALAVVVLFAVWKELGYYTVMFLVGYESIPAECIEAAKLEGAGNFHLITKIILPLLKPTLLLVIVVLLTKCFNSFTPFYIITEGGPANSTETLSMLSYNTGFKFTKMGKASAMIVIMLIVLMLVSVLLNRTSEDKDM